ncbi:MAG: ATP-binding protein [Candidatus Lokiarchaeota archaeon]|nr:ATP-binding protein [Candidatus Lokiarchaeota archaeon]
MILPTILFNLSIIFYFSSIILNLLVAFHVNESIVILEKPTRLISKRGEIPIGRILKGKFRKQKFFLSRKDLEKHMFICGATGTGKSTFLMNFLINFSKIFKTPFFLVEFKGEYHFLQKRIEDVLIYWPGENFSINIFNPGKVSPIIHAERIFDILKSGQFLDDKAEFSPQMEKVLVEILTKTCQDKKYQNWEGFEQFCNIYLKENKNIIPMLNQTLISIKNRIRRFSKGPLKALFEENNKISIDELFDRNILLDLSSIIRLGGEKEDALFFLNMVLKYLWDKNLMQGANDFKGIKHLTIIEDAQYFAPQDLVKKSKITTYLEDIALLQRGTGECLVTLATRPDISKEILANNGIVLTFKNHIEKEIMCELLNLDVENKKYLSILEEGQCIIRVNSAKEPFVLDIPYIERNSLDHSEIYKNNTIILEKLRQDENPRKNSNKPINRYYFKKFVNVFKSLFDLKVKKIGKKKKEKKTVDGQIYIKNLLEIEENISLNDLEEGAFKDLESYIEDLYKTQKEGKK